MAAFCYGARGVVCWASHPLCTYLLLCCVISFTVFNVCHEYSSVLLTLQLPSVVYYLAELRLVRGSVNGIAASGWIDLLR